MIELRIRIERQYDYPKEMGLPPTAIGRGTWRQGYEAAIRDVLRLFDEA